MPLSCKSGEESICSIDYDSARWEELRSLNAAEDRLRLGCCGSRVTLKTSKLGTRFFAHKQRGECTSAGETAEHLFVKACIAQAMAGTGWAASTEVRGVAPDGSPWIADVMATQGSRKVAFEMQWSPQTHEETARRQAQYQASGVRGLWLFKRPTDIVVSKQVPSLLIEVSLDPPSAWVVVPLESPSLYQRDHLARKAEYLWGQRIELGRFIRGCLAGAFVWAPGLNQPVPLEIWAAKQECWKCHRPTFVVTRFDFRVDHVVSGARPISLGLEDFDPAPGTAVIMEALRQVDLKRVGIGALRRRFSRTRQCSYLSNGCVHCDALQGAFYQHEVWHEAEPVLSVHCQMAEGIFSDMAHEEPLRWACHESA